MEKVFEPSTRERANGRPRILINDAFETHESLDVLTFCFENNIVLCRLPSHTSHKLQPCDVSVFSPLKTAYREEVEHLERRGANTQLCSIPIWRNQSWPYLVARVVPEEKMA